jgi:hypothetical protein
MKHFGDSKDHWDWKVLNQESIVDSKSIFPCMGSSVACNGRVPHKLCLCNMLGPLKCLIILVALVPQDPTQ